MPQQDAELTSELERHAGDPLHNRTAYEYMKSYSPYDNMKAQPYPHMLVTAGLSDPRVSYWEVRRAAARQLPACMSVCRMQKVCCHLRPAAKLDAVAEIASIM